MLTIYSRIYIQTVRSWRYSGAGDGLLCHMQLSHNLLYTKSLRTNSPTHIYHYVITDGTPWSNSILAPSALAFSLTLSAFVSTPFQSHSRQPPSTGHPSTPRRSPPPSYIPILASFLVLSRSLYLSLTSPAPLLTLLRFLPKRF